MAVKFNLLAWNRSNSSSDKKKFEMVLTYSYDVVKGDVFHSNIIFPFQDIFHVQMYFCMDGGLKNSL